MKKKIVYVLYNMPKALTIEWVADSSISKDFDLYFVCMSQNPGTSIMDKYLENRKFPVFYIVYKSKWDLPRTILKLILYFRKIKPDIIHTHLFDATFAGLTAAYLTRVSKRIFTRHHSNPNHIHFPHAVLYDRITNFLATHIVATCKNTKWALCDLENVPESKVRVINFGFKLEQFKEISTDQIQLLKKKYLPQTSKKPVIGVISRWMEIKGLQYIIPAFQKLLTKFPNAFLILVSTGNYSYRKTIKALLSHLPADSYYESDFEEDIAALYKVFNIFVHTPINSRCEAFGQTYIEALASEVPSIFSLSGVAAEFIEDGKNALVAEFQSSESIFNALVRLTEDISLHKQLAIQGRKDVESRFPLEKMIRELTDLYNE